MVAALGAPAASVWYLLSDIGKFNRVGSGDASGGASCGLMAAAKSPDRLDIRPAIVRTWPPCSTTPKQGHKDSVGQTPSFVGHLAPSVRQRVSPVFGFKPYTAPLVATISVSATKMGAVLMRASSTGPIGRWWQDELLVIVVTFLFLAFC